MRVVQPLDVGIARIEIGIIVGDAMHFDFGSDQLETSTRRDRQVVDVPKARRGAAPASAQFMHKRPTIGGCHKHFRGARLAMQVGILAGSVDIESMMRVFDRRDRSSPRAQLGNELGNQHRLPGPLHLQADDAGHPSAHAEPAKANRARARALVRMQRRYEGLHSSRAPAFGMANHNVSAIE